MLNSSLLKSTTVLVVEDEPYCRVLLTDLFEHFGAEVIVAASVDEALDVLWQRTPDILVSDIRLPGEDGYHLIEKVRALSQKQGWQIPAVAVTTIVNDEARTRLLEAGFQGYVSKPFEISTLVTLVNQLARGLA